MKRRTITISHTECWSLDETNSRCLNEYDFHSFSGISDYHASFDWSKSSHGLNDPTGIDSWAWRMSKSWLNGLTSCWHIGLIVPDNNIRTIS